MGLLEDYEQQYSVLTAEITSNIGRLGTVSIGRILFSIWNKLSSIKLFL